MIRDLFTLAVNEVMFHVGKARLWWRREQLIYQTMHLFKMSRERAVEFLDQEFALIRKLGPDAYMRHTVAKLNHAKYGTPLVRHEPPN